jgi:hypothetical protein
MIKPTICPWGHSYVTIASAICNPGISFKNIEAIGIMEALCTAHSRSIAVMQMYSLGSIVRARIKKTAPALEIANLRQQMNLSDLALNAK